MSERILTDREVLNRIRLLHEEYNGNYDEASKTHVNKSNFPDEYNTIVNSLSQQIQNVRFDEDAITINKNDTITLKGTIQPLNDMEFIITTDINDGNPLFIDVKNLNLTKEGFDVLGKLFGYATNFNKEWTLDKVKSTFNINNNQ
jgi:hypothetical protein